MGFKPATFSILEQTAHLVIFHHRKSEMLFENEEVWRAVPDRDRRDLYEDVVFFLAKKEKEESKNLRKRNIDSMNNILDSMPNVTFRTTWTDCQQYLMENPTFAEDEELMSRNKFYY